MTNQGPSQPRQVLTDITHWYSKRSNRLQFFATDADLQEVLDAALPAELGPWRLTGADNLQYQSEPPRYQEYPYSLETTQLAPAGDDARGRRRMNMFLWTPSLTTELPPQEPSLRYTAGCSLNGFVLVQRRERRRRLEYFEGALGIVHRVVNHTEGTERDYPEYLKVFNRLRRRLRSLLVQPTVWRSMRYGTEAVSTWERWTERAMKAFEPDPELRFRPLGYHEAHDGRRLIPSS